MVLSHIDLRTPEKMKLVISENQASEFSIHKEFNYFWNFDDFNIYEATAPDRMHLLMNCYTKRSAIEQLENISKFTANDYRNIMKVIIFVIDNLYDDYKEGGIPCKRLCNIFHKYLVMYMKLCQESFTDTELTELETLITEFCQEFVTIFAEYYPSRCKIPKLHVLHYHVIPSIRLYGSMNGMSTETYETLHKKSIKTPYRMTNKRNYVLQMLTTVRRQYLALKQKKPTIRRSSGFRNLLWEFKFTEIEITVSKIKQDTDIHYLYKEGFDNLHTAGTFYGNEWFSDIVVSSKETAWYGKALLLLEFSAKGLKEPVNLALLRWYKEVQEEEIIYDCPRLWLTDQYTCVYLDSVDMSVHIIPRNNCENEYFVNTYIF
ncbi:hypothetical protein GLOIN_2v1803493 [Rhizophagus clarus]|uniref:Uncharacterized protein n=1 Tax=Rhizophagus clarus TaxID=94130 RepID=A0A8H3LCP5_9GLOM|nr:hypothetical protein GLOIN_2v1803493 [Rhizophagus clarus]